MTGEDRLVQFFHKHLVPIGAIFATDKGAGVYIATAFVLAAEGEWFLVTAGHVAEEIVELLEDPSFRLQMAFLYDSGGLEARYRDPIPFALSADKLAILGNQKDYDYAVIHLGEHYKRLLQANGIEPLNEQVWLYQPQDPQLHMLIGVPRQGWSPVYQDDAKTIVSRIDIATMLYTVIHSPDRPEGINPVDYPRWYGHIMLNERISDIKGVSGAPVFAYEWTVNEELRYWLIGVQSSWNPGTRAIAACPAQLLGKFLADAVRKY